MRINPFNDPDPVLPPDAARDWSCVHAEKTATDEEGYAICVRCLAYVVVEFTHEMFVAAVERMKRHRP